MDFNRKQTFSIRKLTLGVASVLIGTIITFGAYDTQVKAETKVTQANTVDEQVQIQYLAVDENELEELERTLIIKRNISDERAVENDTYVLVYQKKQYEGNQLPHTGTQSNIGSLLVAGSLLLLIYQLGKKKRLILGIVILTAGSQMLLLSDVKARMFLELITNHTSSYLKQEDLRLLPLSGYDYVGYIKDEDIPKATTLYQLVNKHKNGFLETNDVNFAIKYGKLLAQDEDLRKQEMSKSESRFEVKSKEITPETSSVNRVKSEGIESEIGLGRGEEKPLGSESASEDLVPESSLGSESASEGLAPESSLGSESASEGLAPESSLGSESASEGLAPESSLGSESASEGLAPESSLGSESASEGLAPESSLGSESASEGLAPESSLGSESASEGLAPESSLGSESASEGLAPESSLGSESASEGLAPESSLGSESASEGLAPESSLGSESASEGLAPESSLGSESASEGLAPESSLGSESASEGLAPESSLGSESASEGLAPESSLGSESASEGLAPESSLGSESASEGLAPESSLGSESASEGLAPETFLGNGVENAVKKVIDAKIKAESALVKRTEIMENQLVTPAEQLMLDGLIIETQFLMTEAVTAINNVDDVEIHHTLMNQLLEIKVPPTVIINDQNANNKIDTAGDVEKVALDIEFAKTKATDAALKQLAITQDSLITPAEQLALDELIKRANDLKTKAQIAVNHLPNSDRRDALIEELTSLMVPSTVIVNDQDANNRIDIAGDVSTAETHVQAAKAKAIAATQKYAEVTGDGVVNPEEKMAVDQGIDEANQLKTRAQQTVNALPESDRKQTLEKELSSISIPQTVTVNDQNRNGKVDTLGDVSTAETHVQAAKAKAIAATQKYAEVTGDGVVNPEEKMAVDQGIDEANQLKTRAQQTVNALPESDRKQTLEKELSSISIPQTVTVNDQNRNGKVDTLGDVSTAETHVQAAKAKAIAATQKYAEVTGDGVINPEEKMAVDQGIDEANQLKTRAQQTVNALPESDRKQTLEKELSSISIPQTVTVNDQNRNGKVDTLGDVSTAETHVQAAKAKAIAATQKYAEITGDGVINPEEKMAVDQGVDEANQLKTRAQQTVNALPESDRKQTLEKELSSISIPQTVTVNDQNRNGKVDTLGDVSTAETHVQAAKAKAIAATQKYAEVTGDGVVNPEEKMAVDQGIDEANQLKTRAQQTVNALPESDRKQTLEKELSSISIPQTVTVNDQNRNGKVDTLGDVSTAETHVQAAKAKAIAATQKYAEVTGDGVVNPEEKMAVDQGIDEANQLKTRAQQTVNALPESDRKQTLEKELSSISIPQTVTVNDQNRNGKVDTLGDVSTAETHVQAAKAKAIAATQKYAEVTGDGVVNPEEKMAVDQGIDEANQLKTRAQQTVNALPESDRKQTLEKELSSISIPQTVTVNDQNRNGKVDTLGDVSTAETHVQAAKAKAIAATQKYAEVTGDGVINPEEKMAVDQGIDEANQLKTRAQQTVNALPESDRKQTLEKELSSISIPQTVTVNDQNRNGKVDTLGDVSTAETHVQAAKAKAIAATQKYAEVTGDGVVNPEEKMAVDQGIDEANQLKTRAQQTVNALPESDRKQTLEKELSSISIPQTVTVNDQNRNGKVDTLGDVSTAETHVQAAKAKAIAATQKYAEITGDGVINPEEKMAVDQGIDEANQLKTRAQQTVNALPESDRKQTLEKELSSISIPQTVTVNDQNRNGKVDTLGDVSTAETHVQAAKAKAIAATQKYAEVTGDGVINPEEKMAVDQGIDEANQLKTRAQQTVNALPESDRKQTLEKELSSISIPQTVTVNDQNRNGKVDTLGDVSTAETHVQVAKAKAIAATQKYAEVTGDGVVNPEEKMAVDQGIDEANQLKTRAQQTVNALPESDRKQTLEKELSSISIPQTVTVNDQNRNGKVDTLGDVSTAETHVQAAKAKAIAATQKYAEVTGDGVINPEEKMAVDQGIDEANQLKTRAQQTVNALPESDRKQTLEKELSSISIPQTVTVNDQNRNGKVDTLGDVSTAETHVQAAKAKAILANERRAEIVEQQVVTEQDKEEMDRLITETNQRKESVKRMVDALQDSDARDNLLNQLMNISAPDPVEVTVSQEITEKERIETRITLKNVEEAYLYKLNSQNQFEKVLSLDKVETNMANYKVKVFLKDANKYIWLDVKNIVSDDTHYRVETSFDKLLGVSDSSNITNAYTIKVVKRKPSIATEYTSFAMMIDAMKQQANGINIEGTYIVADHMSASEMMVGENNRSYLDNYIFKGTLKSKNGNVFSLTDLKKPLFDCISDASISNINLKDVDISSLNIEEVGSLANNARNSQINNIIVNGNIRGNDLVGGIIGTLDHSSRLENSSYMGIVSSLHSLGGLVAHITRSSVIRNSVADVSISITANSSDSIGGLAAQVSQNAFIENSYVKGTINNNGDKTTNIGSAVGTMYAQGMDRGTLNNVVSFMKVNGGRDFIGNIEELKASKQKWLSNNFVVSDISTGTDIKDSDEVATLSKEDADNKVAMMYIPPVINSIVTNRSKVMYHQITDYQESHAIAYENLTKLLPFYDQYTIVREANRLVSTDSLNTKTIQFVQTYVNNELLKDLYTEKNLVNKVLIYYTDGSKEVLDLVFKSAFKDTGIIDYTVSGRNLTYHPNVLAKDNSAIIEAVANEFQTLVFDYELFDENELNNEEVAFRGHKIEKLYLKDHFDKVKARVADDLRTLLNQYEIADYTEGSLKEHMITKIRDKKHQILIGFNYLERWYDFSEAKSSLLYALDSYGTNYNALDLVIDVGSQTLATLASNQTDNVYNQVLAKYTGKSTLGEFIVDLYQRTKVNFNQDIDDWFKNTTSAYLINTNSSERPNSKETILARLLRPRYRHWILPLLTIKEENVYAFFTTNSSNVGIFDPYISASKNTEQYQEELRTTKRKVDVAAKSMQEYFDVWYRILNDESVEKMLEMKIKVFDSYRNRRNRWSTEYGSRAFDSVKAFIGPIGAWIGSGGNSSAYTLDRAEKVHFTGINFLGSSGLSILTHEHVHNFDRKIYFNGYGRRFGHGAESFALGLLQTPTTGSSVLGVNLVDDVGDNNRNLLLHNASPKRFQNADDLQKYMKGVFDVLYTLDLAEAEVLLENKSEMRNYKKLMLSNGQGQALDDIVTELGDVANISSVDDLVDQGVVGRNIRMKKYGTNSYIEVDMFEAHYGINENPDGASGGLTLRRVAFELLAEKGYYAGMVPYLSNQYYFTLGEDKGKGISDSDILHKIFEGQYDSYKAFRKEMFHKRKVRVGDLKSVETWTFNTNRTVIHSYDDIKHLIRQAFKKGDARAVADIKRNIYQAYLLATHEFRESIYESNQPE